MPFGSASWRLRRFCMINKNRWFLRNSLGGQVMSLLSVALLSTLVVFSLSVFYFVNRTENEAWQGRQSEAARNAAGIVSSSARSDASAATTVASKGAAASASSRATCGAAR